MELPVNLDHAASTPPRHEVVATMIAALHSAHGGNPAAGHTLGRLARETLEDARERIGAAVGRSPHEVVLTSGGTEADQLGVVGTYRAAKVLGEGQHIVCSAVEHPAIRDAVTWLAEVEGAQVTWVAPEGVRPLDPAAVLAVVRDDTVVVAVTGADGEVGVAQCSDELAAACAERGVPLHTDAVQRIATRELPTTGSLALSGHKLGSPVGIGAAVLPRDVAVGPLVPGPGQERGLRSGTQPAALALALATAVEMAVAERADHAAHCGALTARLAGHLAQLDGVRPSIAVDDPARLASHLHLQLDGVDGEALAMALDEVGVAAARGSACATGTAVVSPVLAAYGIEADAVLRCSVGRSTTEEEVDIAAERMVDVLQRLRANGGGFL